MQQSTIIHKGGKTKKNQGTNKKDKSSHKQKSKQHTKTKGNKLQETTMKCEEQKEEETMNSYKRHQHAKKDK